MFLRIPLSVQAGARDSGRTDAIALLGTLPAFTGIRHATTCPRGTPLAGLPPQTGIAHVQHLGRLKGARPSPAILALAPALLSGSPAGLSGSKGGGPPSLHSPATVLQGPRRLAFSVESKLRADVHGNGLGNAPVLSLADAAVPEGTAGLHGRSLAGLSLSSHGLRLGDGLAGISLRRFAARLRRQWRTRRPRGLLPALVLWKL